MESFDQILAAMDAMRRSRNKEAVQAYTSEIPYDKIKKWIRECEDHDCPLHGPADPIQKLKVICCTQSPPTVVYAPKNCQYVALSYVWGDTKEKSYSEGDELRGDEIAQTIRDSIEVTLKLGYSYLWVDRFCINQQSEDDKSHQIAQMGSIYAQAVLTVFAVIGDDPSCGLPGVMVPRERYFGVTRSELQNWWNEIAVSTWVRRGWTMQESYLSKRRLFITQSQVIFGCNRHIYLEDGSEPTDVPYVVDVFGPGLLPSHRTGLDATEMLVQLYSDRSIRHDDDALNAITGVLSSPTRAGSFYKQFWCVPFEVTERFPKLDVCLDWFTMKRGRRRVDFPSWSPLGWTSGIRFGSHRHQERIRTVNSTAIEVFIDGSWLPWASLASPESQAMWIKPPLESQILRITTSTSRLSLVWKKKVVKTYDGCLPRKEGELFCRISGLLCEPHWDTAPEISELGSDILCAEIDQERKQVLLIKPKSSDKSCYERVGILSSYLLVEEDGWWDGMFEQLLRHETLRTRQTRTFLLA